MSEEAERLAILEAAANYAEECIEADRITRDNLPAGWRRDILTEGLQRWDAELEEIREELRQMRNEVSILQTFRDIEAL